MGQVAASAVWQGSCVIEFPPFFPYCLSMNSNRRYKDSVISWLFSDTDALRELYGALEGAPLDPSVPNTVNTLESVLYMDQINDISFEVGDKLVVLIEHQSTINPNMALRLLMYIARIYEKLVEHKNIYSGKLIKLPWPEFFVLYNGLLPYPDESIIRLSDSFADLAASGISVPPDLELVVKVYNINNGHNEHIVKKSRTLIGYSAFVAKVREYEKMPANKEAAMKQAIRYCIDHDILKEFLQTNSSEVINMLLTEWNWDDYIAVQRAEAREDALAEGEARGEARGERRGGEAKTEEVLRYLNEGYSMEDLKRLLQKGPPSAGLSSLR
jgi:hypothetical protein